MINPSDYIVILGANDFEMREIKNMFIDQGFSVFDGLDKNLRNCNTYSAYHVFDIHNHYRLEKLTPIFIECRPIGGFPQKKYYYFDHHLPKNSNFYKSIKEFMPASSLGQVYEFLYGEKITFNDNKNVWMIGQNEIKKEHVFIAASDHCMIAAMKGRCPGVNPNEFEKFRKLYLMENSKFGVLPDIDLEEDCKYLRSLQKIKLGNYEYILVVGFIQVKCIFDACNKLNDNMLMCRPFKNNVYVHIYSFMDNYDEVLEDAHSSIKWISVVKNAERGLLAGEVNKKEFQNISNILL